MRRMMHALGGHAIELLLDQLVHMAVLARGAVTLGDGRHATRIDVRGIYGRRSLGGD